MCERVRDLELEMKRRLRLGPTQSPVVSTTLNRRYTEARAVSVARWGTACLFLALPLLLDLYLHLLSYYSGLRDAVVWYIEVLVLGLLALSGLYDCVFCSHVALSRPHVELTPAQKKLLRVGTGPESGYDTVNTPTPFGVPLPQPLSSSSLSQISPLALLTPSRHPSPYITPRSPHTPQSSHSTPAHTPRSGGVISSQQALESYLSSETERELGLTPDLSWPPRPSPDTPSTLRKYHVATRGQSPSRDSGSPLVTEDDAVWVELGISRGNLIRWTENCRRWLAETVFVPVAAEIDKINQTLAKGSTPTVKIGAASSNDLRRESKRRAPQVPTLHLVLPYLELTSKQAYLVQRIRELSSGGCLSVYRWNGGGAWNGRPWTQELPTDPQIVLHLLCVYLDSHLPLSPLFTNGRPFTSHYLIKSPDKPVARSPGVAVYQSTLLPPHYNIVVGDKLVDIPKGRNNLFQAIVALLHLLKTGNDSSSQQQLG
ncbi:Transmembrane protein 209 [Geodia barretti]|nr:Transmembrane protein 209 [Geodia barretti]